MRLFVFAMQEEVRGLRYNKHDDNLYKFIGVENAFFVLTGVGKIQAAMKVTEMIMKYDVESVINVGFSGATKEYRIGDVVLIEKATFHDFDLTTFGYEHGQVPGFDKWFSVDRYLKLMITKKLINLKFGNLFTGDKFMTDGFTERMVFDMEGAAIALVCKKFNKPWASIKIITDNVGVEQQINEYQEFIKQGDPTQAIVRTVNILTI